MQVFDAVLCAEHPQTNGEVRAGAANTPTATTNSLTGDGGKGTFCGAADVYAPAPTTREMHEATDLAPARTIATERTTIDPTTANRLTTRAAKGATFS